MTSTNGYGLIGDGEYREEDVPYWTFIISRLANASQTFWVSLAREQAQMNLLEMYLAAGQLGHIAFTRND